MLFLNYLGGPFSGQCRAR